MPKISTSLKHISHCRNFHAITPLSALRPTSPLIRGDRDRTWDKDLSCLPCQGEVAHSVRRRGFILVSVMMLGVMLISCATAFAWFVRMQVRSVGRERESLTNRSMALVLANSVMSALSAVSSRVNYNSV